MAPDPPPAPSTWELDPDYTQVEFVARHMLTKVRGRFTGFSGTIDLAFPPEDSAVEVRIETATIQTNLTARDNHLRSSDFLEVGEHPIMTFRSSDVRITGEDAFELDGDLTIRDITNPVTLRGTYAGWGPDPEGTDVFTCSAKATIDREDWDMTWNTVVETGGLFVGKNVDIEIEVHVKRVG